MRLSALIGRACSPDPDISGITSDSRAVMPGFLFAALLGEKSDGAAFISNAEAAGAAAILAQPGVSTRVALVEDREPRRMLAQMASRFYPRQPEIVAGVTGTNGKSSTVRFAAQLWNAVGIPAGSLGTIGAEAPNFHRKLEHTTSEPVALHQTIEAMSAAGVRRLAMEVSSHALAQFRADGVSFRIAAFTNITQDHLDFHRTFEAYFSAKQRLFAELLHADGAAVVNADGEGAADVVAIAAERRVPILTTGAAGADIRLRGVSPTDAGMDIVIAAAGRDYAVALPLVGAFQAENALLAAGIVASSGVALADLPPLLARLEGAPGRMQRVAAIGGASVYVDYAHTPDAVATALAAVRPHAAGKVIAIIGAGGDRDRSKRPLMGSAASRCADIVIVTDDNPRSEDPAAIRRAVIAGATGAIEIADRAQAIAHAVTLLDRGDALVIAGKGHETGQIVQGKTIPFDDAETARASVCARGGNAI